MKLVSCKSALRPTVVYSTDLSKAVVPVLVLLFVALWFILRGDLFYFLLCIILFLCLSVLLALRLPHLGKRELILVLFVRLFDLRLFGLFPLPLGVWEGLWFVIVALPGLFSYLFFFKKKNNILSKYVTTYTIIHMHMAYELTLGTERKLGLFSSSLKQWRLPGLP